MRDKVAQRERTEELVGGARTFNEFVKERASSNNLTPACVRSLPEIKEEWKQIKAKQLAEKKAEKAKTTEAKKAEKKALSEAKKAEKKATKEATKAVVKEKTTIKKVAKKSNADAENIKMVLVEKAKATVPPAEPKVKGRPKKYATPEEARRAKIEATKVLNRAKKAQQPPKEKKPRKSKKAPSMEEMLSLEKEGEKMEREEMGMEDMSEKKKRTRQRRVVRQKKENETMGMEDDDAPTTFTPDVLEAERRIYTAKTNPELDVVLRLIKKVIPDSVYNKLDKYNKKSIDQTIKVYKEKRESLLKKQVEQNEMLRQANENRELFKKAKANAPQRRKELAENEAMMSEDINRAKKTKKPRVIQRKNVGKIVRDTPYHVQFPSPPEWHGKGLNPADLKEFKNYDKIQEHLGQHLNDLKEAIDPKDVRDFIHFTKEKARLKKKLVGGVVRTMGGYSSSDSGTESESDIDGYMEGGESLGFFGNIKRAFTNVWDRPATDQEKQILRPILNAEKFITDNVISTVAPPVGKIADAQRRLLEDKYLSNH